MAGPVPVDKTALMPKPVPASCEDGGPVSPESLADKARAGANAPKKKDPRKIAAIVAGIIVAIAVVGGGTWAFINYQHQPVSYTHLVPGLGKRKVVLVEGLVRSLDGDIKRWVTANRKRQRHRPRIRCV